MLSTDHTKTKVGKMNRPTAVLISDIHYNLQNLEPSDKAMNLAIDKANELRIPLLVAGDLHDQKANLRGECVKVMIETFKRCNSPPYVLIGNHCKIHEKSEEHSLEFLRPFAAIIDYLPGSALHKIGYLIPYQHDIEKLKTHIKRLPPNSQLIMHQGIQGSNSGEYYQDKTALHVNDVAGHRVISGHYHARQTINLPDSGKWDYIGTPFTMNFGEANDPEKGYQILHSDGTLEFIPLNLRKHMVYEASVRELKEGFLGLKKVNDGDLLWIKLTGTKEELNTISKEFVSKLIKVTSFKLDLMPIGSELQAPVKKLTNPELLDCLIDATDNSPERKENLKQMWRFLSVQ